VPCRADNEFGQGIASSQRGLCRTFSEWNFSPGVPTVLLFLEETRQVRVPPRYCLDIKMMIRLRTIRVRDITEDSLCRIPCQSCFQFAFVYRDVEFHIEHTPERIQVYQMVVSRCSELLDLIFLVVPPLNSFGPSSTLREICAMLSKRFAFAALAVLCGVFYQVV
jgi:hypothetical protein